MQRRKFLKYIGIGAATAAIPTKVAAKQIAKTKQPPKPGYKYRWTRTDRIETMLESNWQLVNQFDMENGLEWSHVGGLHLIRKIKS